MNIAYEFALMRLLLDYGDPPRGNVQPAKVAEKSYYTIKEVAARHGVCDMTVRRLIERGELQRDLGIRHVRIPVASLEAYEKRNLSRKPR